VSSGVTCDSLYQPIQLHSLPKQDPLVGAVVVVHPHVIQIRMVRDGRKTPILRVRIDQRKVHVRPVSLRLAPQHLVARDGQRRLAPVDKIRRGGEIHARRAEAARAGVPQSRDEKMRSLVEVDAVRVV